VRFQKQRFRGGPDTPAGEFGDCHRTCVAMILNMHRDDVPHFMADCHPGLDPEHPDSVAAEKRELEWLARRGLTAVNVPFPGDTLIIDLLEMLSKLTHGAPVVLGCSVNGWRGSTRGPTGANHSVVVHEGKIYNPHPGTTVTGPMRDGMWWLTIYSVGPNWRSPRLLDRLRGWLR
jgi:hypothetical protein